MARPKHRKARKDYPNHGIAKGDMYWFVAIKTSPYSSRIMRQKEPFRRSQLTTSNYLSQLYDWQDGKSALDDMNSAQDFADSIRSLGEECSESLENMPEGLKEGSTGGLLNERMEACEQAATDIEEIISEWESAESDWNSAIETFQEEMQAYKDQPEGGDLEEPDLPDHSLDNGDDTYEFDASEFVSRVQEVDVDG